MNRITLPQVFLSLSILTLCGLTVACGGGGRPSASSTLTVSAASTQHPLVAQVSVASSCDGMASVEFGPDLSYGRTTASYPVQAGNPGIKILVAGMRASSIYHMLPTVQCASGTLTGRDLIFQTGPLPSFPFPAMTVTRPAPSTSSPENPGIELINVVAPAQNEIQAYFTDRDANPIWYYDVGQNGNYPFTMKLLPNGHVILSIATPTSSILREVDLAGNTVREMDITALAQLTQAAGYDFVPTFYHHDVLPLANGHLIVLTETVKPFTDLPGYPGTTQVVGDALIDLDSNWNPVWSWNGFDHLDVNRHLNGLPDWTHSNALVYSASDGNLLLSMRHQSWVLKIDYNNGAGTGNVLWRLGYQGDFALTQSSVPTDDPSEWFSFQHFPSIVSQTGSQTTLAIWDNGDDRVVNTSNAICGPFPSTPCDSRATIFQVDESAMVANLLWDTLPGYYGIWGGSINQLEDGNVEFDVNSPQTPNTLASEVQEVTQTSTPQIVWKMDFPAPSNAYRAYRVPSLYPNVTWQY
jgi:arylsulfate sulfotransferase